MPFLTCHFEYEIHSQFSVLRSILILYCFDLCVCFHCLRLVWRSMPTHACDGVKYTLRLISMKQIYSEAWGFMITALFLFLFSEFFLNCWFCYVAEENFGVGFSPKPWSSKFIAWFCWNFLSLVVMPESLDFYYANLFMQVKVLIIRMRIVCVWDCKWR